MARRLKILMIIPSLPMGGAERSFVRQANALAQHAGHDLTCYVPWCCDSEPALLRELDRRIHLAHLPLATQWLHRVIYKLTLCLPKLNLEQRLHNVVLSHLHRRHSYDVVNAHLHSGTRMACLAFAHIPVPVIETDHGDYALLLSSDRAPSTHQPVLERLDGMVCLSHPNQDRIAALPWRASFQSRIIPNTYTPPPERVTPAWPDDDIFTFGMVSRGVPEKGWREAITAFERLRQHTTQPCRLVLVGGGAHLEQLARELSDELRPHVTFAGEQSDPRPWIEGFDVGLLPSYFAAESLPNAIIECLAQSKPVIATSIGGIPDMLTTTSGPCGLQVPLDAETQRADVSALASAMHQMLTEPNQRQALAQRTQAAVARYHPSTIAKALTDFFIDTPHHPQTNTPLSRPAACPLHRASSPALPPHVR